MVQEQTQDNNIINGKELMARLMISEPTLIRWRKKGKIPYYAIGSAIRYDLQKVLNALEVNKKGASK